MPSELELCNAILDGNSQAEATLYTQFHPKVLFILRQRARQYGEMDIEDLAQETMIVVIKRLRSRPLDDPNRLAGYIQKTAQNLYIGRVRLDAGRQTYPVSEIPDYATEAIPDVFGTVLESEAKLLVQNLLDELNVDRDREILLQHYILGLDKAVVCENLGLSANQFDKVIYKARGRLKTLAEQHAAAIAS